MEENETKKGWRERTEKNVRERIQKNMKQSARIERGIEKEIEQRNTVYRESETRMQFAAERDVGINGPW